MLETIKESINNLPDTAFAEFYQDYVISTQQSILDHDMKIAKADYNNIADVNQLIKGLNVLTEELKSR